MVQNTQIRTCMHAYVSKSAKNFLGRSNPELNNCIEEVCDGTSYSVRKKQKRKKKIVRVIYVNGSVYKF